MRVQELRKRQYSRAGKSGHIIETLHQGIESTDGRSIGSRDTERAVRTTTQSLITESRSGCKFVGVQESHVVALKLGWRRQRPEGGWRRERSLRRASRATESRVVNVAGGLHRGCVAAHTTILGTTKLRGHGTARLSKRCGWFAYRVEIAIFVVGSVETVVLLIGVVLGIVSCGVGLGVVEIFFVEGSNSIGTRFGIFSGIIVGQRSKAHARDATILGLERIAIRHSEVVLLLVLLLLGHGYLVHGFELGGLRNSYGKTGGSSDAVRLLVDWCRRRGVVVMLKALNRLRMIRLIRVHRFGNLDERRGGQVGILTLVNGR